MNANDCVPGYRVIFPESYSGIVELETESKGFLDGVIVEGEDGTRYLISFRDSWNVSLEHDQTGSGRFGSYLFIPNLVIVSSVSREMMLFAIGDLFVSGQLTKLRMDRSG